MATVTTLFGLNQPANGSMAAQGSTETITLMVRDVYGNVVTTAAPAGFVASPSHSTLGAWTCTSGVCMARRTAPSTTATAYDHRDDRRNERQRQSGLHHDTVARGACFMGVSRSPAIGLTG